MLSIFNRNKYVLEGISVSRGMLRQYSIFDYDTKAPIIEIEEKSDLVTGVLRMTMLGGIIPFAFKAYNPIGELVFTLQKEAKFGKVSFIDVLNPQGDIIAQFPRDLLFFSKPFEVWDTERNPLFTIKPSFTGKTQFFTMDNQLMAELSRKAGGEFSWTNLLSGTSNSRMFIEIKDVVPPNDILRRIILATVIYLQIS
ncbi:hypothetical protein [uncultured Microscilla sp.]|uniref:hypothetical protein n=1 Tax=uncultured Microscilla sp. TaxID=432653 RepID=UPI002632090D|nr:hypothetical protein [uncultured Microscilla sp.]